MKLIDILTENDEDHQKALDATGFWGKQGAGAIILSASTGRLLLPYRSMDVEQPHTWGVWGGAIDEDESPMEGATREVNEEMGKVNFIKKYPMYVFTSGSFRYSNFLFVAEDEFKPIATQGSGWETESYMWVDYGDWPEPLHFGLEALIKNSGSEIQAIIKKYAGQI